MSKATIAKRGRSPRRVLFAAILSLLTVMLIGLGIWQIERRTWKLELIARVNARVHAEPVPPPAREQWAAVNRGHDEYRRLTVAGTFENELESLVYASTVLGPGFWVMTPLRLSDGTTILINRGFVPLDKRDPSTRQAVQLSGRVIVTGLMRMSEPKGSILRRNDPSADRWYSRDVSAIAGRQRLTDFAPYFVDADAISNPGGFPVGGLTVVDFPNNHLVYAITWLTLAAMAAGLAVMTSGAKLGKKAKRMHR